MSRQWQDGENWFHFKCYNIAYRRFIWWTNTSSATPYFWLQRCRQCLMLCSMSVLYIRRAQDSLRDSSTELGWLHLLPVMLTPGQPMILLTKWCCQAGDYRYFTILQMPLLITKKCYIKWYGEMRIPRASTCRAMKRGFDDMRKGTMTQQISNAIGFEAAKLTGNGLKSRTDERRISSAIHT